MGVFEKGEVGRVYFPYLTQDIKDMAFNLVSTDENRRAEAMQALEVKQITPSEILAKSYSELASALELHERHIVEIEVRRRKLRDDYDRLKTTRALPVE